MVKSNFLPNIYTLEFQRFKIPENNEFQDRQISVGCWAKAAQWFQNRADAKIGLELRDLIRNSLDRPVSSTFDINIDVIDKIGIFCYLIDTYKFYYIRIGDLAEMGSGGRCPCQSTLAPCASGSNKPPWCPFDTFRPHLWFAVEQCLSWPAVSDTFRTFWTSYIVEATTVSFLHFVHSVFTIFYTFYLFSTSFAYLSNDSVSFFNRYPFCPFFASWIVLNLELKN